ncbi:putative thylakoid lumen protein [Chlorella vulgaris]
MSTAALQLRPGSSTAFAAGRRLSTSSRAAAPRRRSSSRNSRRDVTASAQDSRNALEVLYVGRAIAEVLSERLGAAFGDALADFGRLDAETRQAMREFQEDVMARAQREMAASAGGSGSSVASDGTSTTTFGSAAGAPPDLPALVDDLRAEVASARAVVQQLKLKQQDQPRW